ncbi:MAG TPA: glycerol-3-phosphate dehydrogenase/oxidase [Flavobacteriales bacterium]|nr:glycerol-3-phosphate dehydrogenase/oxidase [Flavobacteriales bacterium]
MNPLSSLNRPALIQDLSSQEFDLLIIGGGITGAGIALDATLRGIKTALVEMQDFAAGTSSKSTKLIHGGLRYLKQGEVRLVREVGKERAILYRNAPHMVIPESMLLPLVKGGSFGKYGTWAGLALYDRLASVKPGEKRRMLNRQQTIECEPLLNKDLLNGGCIYSEYRTNDARLTLEVIKTASDNGARAANYLKVESLSYVEEKVIGVSCRDLLTDTLINIKATKIVNASGPWVDDLRRKDNSLTNQRLHHTKGVHIVVSHERFPVNQSAYFDVFDKRMVFVIPRGKTTYIGTTDTDFDKDLVSPEVTKKDVAYLLKAANTMFPTVELSQSDIISSWAGIRPLIHQEGKSASEISRKDEIFHSDSGLISIAGGKLTGFRKMAQRVVDLVIKELHNEIGLPLKSCITSEIQISGGGIGNLESYTHDIFKRIQPHGFEIYDAERLVRTYGDQSQEIVNKLIERHISNPQTELALAELDFIINNESLYHLLDFFTQKTARLWFNKNTIPNLIEPVGSRMQELLGWEQVQLTEEQQSVHQALKSVVNFQ